MTTNNHPAHGPVSLDRLHQIREILSKAAAQSDGGGLGYAMADAVKVIDGAIAAFDAEPVAVNDDMAYTFHHALSDSSLGADEMEEIKIGLRAAFANIAAPQTAPVVSDIDTIALNTARNVMCDINRMEGWPGGDVQLLAHIQSRIDEACRAAMLQGAEPVSQPYMLPPLDYLDTVKFNADCAIQDPDSIYTNEFFLSLDEVFGERGNYSEPVQAKAVSMLIAEVFRLRGYSRAAPHQEAKSALEHGMQRYAGAMQKLADAGD
ncbi:MULTISPECIES: hypothetical protein [Citrobacter]|uniref:hypothetical protein n=1 Tax=Citrobacter TaxID=544 RepID=UPI0025783813|nr:hypothetical protein [Citrobacter sp. Cf087]MDM3229183.1 hypothetical protein [Citrobacter sp. Cf087]